MKKIRANFLTPDFGIVYVDDNEVASISIKEDVDLLKLFQNLPCEVELQYQEKDKSFKTVREACEYIMDHHTKRAAFRRKIKEASSRPYWTGKDYGSYINLTYSREHKHTLGTIFCSPGKLNKFKAETFFPYETLETTTIEESVKWVESKADAFYQE